MPEGKSIYDVAFGAGSETGKYSAELLKTEDIWERMSHRGEVTDWKIEQEATMANVAMDTLGLVSEAYGGYKAEKEFESALADTSERAAKTAYTKGETARSLKDKDEAVKWSDLDISKQEEWLGKFKPEQKKQEWYETLFGREPEYKFGESEYFKRSSITASQALSEATSLEDMVDVENWAGKTTTMADEAGISQETKINKEPEVKKELEVKKEPEKLEFSDDKKQSIKNKLVVSPTSVDPLASVTPDKDEFEYKTRGAGSREWFEKQIKQFKQRNQRPEISGPATGYNVQLEKLARGQGWTGSSWK